jgi:beta-galactosidase GanA
MAATQIPETAAHLRNGEPMPYGARQDINHPHPAFRRLAERLIRKIVSRYAGHPAVIGWQVDNEPGHNILHNPDGFQGFVEYLRERHGDVQRLNERWGLTYWSHRLADWSDLWRPEGNTTPSYDLAWRRYQAQLTHEYIAWQAQLVRSLVPEHHFITTCLALHQPAWWKSIRPYVPKAMMVFPRPNATKPAWPCVEGRPLWREGRRFGYLGPSVTPSPGKAVLLPRGPA